MNAWTIYWWTRLDPILIACILITFITGFSQFPLWFEDVKPNKYFATLCFILFGLLAVFIPTSKQYAMIYVIPKVVNSEVLQKDIPVIYDVGIAALKKKLTEIAEE